MKISIEHIAIYTSDLERAKAFYQKYFNAESNEKYQNKSGFSSYFLTFSSGPRVEMMSHTELVNKEVLDKVSGISHIAFSLSPLLVLILLFVIKVSDVYPHSVLQAHVWQLTREKL